MMKWIRSLFNGTARGNPKLLPRTLLSLEALEQRNLLSGTLLGSPILGQRLTATLSNGGPGTVGSPVKVLFSNPSDSIGGQAKIGFHYTFALETATLASSYSTAQTSASTLLTFSVAGSYKIYGRIFDSLNNASTYTTTVKVKNAVPTATFSNDGPVSEATPVTVSLSNATSTSSADTQAGFHYSYALTQSALATTYSAAGTAASAQFAFDDNGSFKVYGRILSQESVYSTYVTTVVVKNVPPTATLSNNGPVSPAIPVTVSFGNVSDPSTADTNAGFHYSFALSTVSLAKTYATAGTPNSVKFTFAQTGTYTVYGRIFDNDNSYTDYTTQVTVNDLPPTATISSNGPVSEGTPVTLSLTNASSSSSADTQAGFHYSFALSLDGLATTYAAAGTGGSAQFTYNQSGSYSVYGRIFGQSNSFSTYSTTVVINDAAPTVSANSSSVTVSASSASNGGSFSDFDDTVTVTASEGAIVQTGTQSGTWSWSESGLALGTRTVTVTATNANGMSTSVSFDLQVSAPSVPDAGFEEPDVGSGTWTSFVYNVAGSPWSFVGLSGISGNGSGFTGFNPNAPQGTQVAILQKTGTFSQSLDFPAGTYTISFAAAQRFSHSQTSTQTIIVEVDGNVVGTIAPAGTRYAIYATQPFTVTAGTHTLQFVGLDPGGGDVTAFIDEVNVTAGSSAITNLTVSPSSLLDATANSAYSATVNASGGSGTYTFSVTSGNLPSWLWLDGATGILSGTPTTTSSSSFTITATDSNNTALIGSQAYALTVNAASSLTVNPSSLSAATESSSYSATIKATGGSGNYTFTITTGSLPSGLSLNASSGVLSGTATASGSFSFTIQAMDNTNSSLTGSRAYTLAVNTGSTSSGPSFQAITLDGTSYLLAGSAAVFSVSNPNQPPAGGFIYSWTFGDGATDVTTTPIDSHTYGSAGTYNASVTVTDNQGETSTSSAPLTVLPSSASADPLFKPVVNSSSFTYLGSFALPKSANAWDTAYSYGGLAYRYVNGNLQFFTTNHVYSGGLVYEFNYPGIGIDPSQRYDLTIIPKAHVVNQWGDVYTNQKLDNNYGGYTSLSSGDPTYGLYYDQTANRLYWNYGDWYNADFPYQQSIGYSTLDDTTVTATGAGAWSLANRPEKFDRGGVLQIPQWFADRYTNGYTLAAGMGGYFSITSTASFGPALAAFAAPDPAVNPNNSSLANIPLLGYPTGAPDRAHRDTAYTSYYDGGNYPTTPGNCNPANGTGYWTWSDSIFDAGTWIDTPTMQGVLFIAKVGQGNVWYQSSDRHTQNGSYEWMVYNPADLAAVASGAKQQWQIQPVYEWTTPTLPFGYFDQKNNNAYSGDGTSQIGGAVFDPTTNRLYVLQENVLSNLSEAWPEMYVYQVGPPPAASTPGIPFVVSDTQAGFSETGTSWSGIPNGYGGEQMQLTMAAPGTATATWQASGLAAGSYTLAVDWNIPPNSNTAAAVYQIFDGTTLMDTVTINQQKTPMGVIKGGVLFQDLATVHISSGSLSVVLVSQASGDLAADALLVTPN